MNMWELIQNNIEARRLARNGDISGCSSIINRKNQRGPVPIQEIVMWTILNGTLANIKKNILSILNEDVYNDCVLFDALLTYNKNNIDLDNEKIKSLIESMTKNGIFSEEQKEELMQLAENRVSISFKLRGKDCTVDEITEILKRGS